MYMHSFWYVTHTILHLANKNWLHPVYLEFWTLIVSAEALNQLHQVDWVLVYKLHAQFTLCPTDEDSLEF